MKFITRGKSEKPTILMIHGMGCTGEKSFLSSVRKLEDDYQVIVVCLDGYDEANTTFTTIYDQAEKIAEYVINNYGSSIYTILGMSMGGFIALELLTKYSIKVEKLILDSGYMKPWNKLCSKIMSIMVAHGFKDIMKGKNKLLNRMAMNYAMGYCFKGSDLCEFASKDTLINSEYSCLTYELDNIEALKNINVEYWYGQKERYMIEGMKFLKEKLPNMKEVCVGNYGHGELMMSQAEFYGEMVFKAINPNL